MNDLLDHLPQLEGSEKQIAWATRIRQEIIKAYLPKITKPEGLKMAEYVLLNITSAKAWIDNREFVQFLTLCKKYRDQALADNTD